MTMNYAHTNWDPRDISLDSLIKRQGLYGNNRVINVCEYSTISVPIY